MTRGLGLLARLFPFATCRRANKNRRRPSTELLEERALPSFLTQLANVDGYATDSNQDGVFESVNTTGTSVQASSVPSTSSTTDQTNTPTPYQAYSTSASSNLAMGQEFKPLYSSLNY